MILSNKGSVFCNKDIKLRSSSTTILYLFEARWTLEVWSISKSLRDRGRSFSQARVTRSASPVKWKRKNNYEETFEENYNNVIPVGLIKVHSKSTNILFLGRNTSEQQTTWEDKFYRILWAILSRQFWSFYTAINYRWTNLSRPSNKNRLTWLFSSRQ